MEDFLKEFEALLRKYNVKITTTVDLNCIPNGIGIYNRDSEAEFGEDIYADIIKEYLVKLALQ